MRAAIFNGPKDITVGDRPDPAIEEPTDAVVRVVMACVCGSDLWYYRGESEHAVGSIGHEFIGVVEDIGSEVSGVSVGDLVVAPFIYSDMSCPHCQHGSTISCVQGGNFGNGTIDGGQGEAVRVPLAGSTLVSVPGMGHSDAMLKSLLTLGAITGVIHAAGVSPSQAPPAAILSVDLYGTAVLLEELGDVIAPGGAGVVIASQSGHRLGALTADEDRALATTPAEELLDLPLLQGVTDPLHAYQLAKRGNALRVRAEAVRWAERGARLNCMSPGIVMTPLANDELTGPRGEGYRRMLELSPAGRAGTPDEIANLAALLLGPDGAFITGSDFLIDGGVTASYFYGPLAPQPDKDHQS